jgi:hypothetical protein
MRDRLILIDPIASLLDFNSLPAETLFSISMWFSLYDTHILKEGAKEIFQTESVLCAFEYAKGYVIYLTTDYKFHDSCVHDISDPHVHDELVSHLQLHL